MPCECSDKNPRVIEYFRVHWKNGYTDVQIRKLKRGYRIIEHCCEHRSRDGTAVSQIRHNIKLAESIAKIYAYNIASWGGPNGEEKGTVEKIECER